MSHKIILYHGSTKKIYQPLYGVGNPKNDYGLGFYCTKEIELAKEWACTSELNGYANQYELDLNGLTILDLNNGSYHILNWLAVLLENRTFRISGDIARKGKEYCMQHFLPNYKMYDVIKGYRADDSYFSFASAFLNNTISLFQLERAMLLGKLGEQVVIRSEEALKKIKYINSVSAQKEVYYPKKMERDIDARESFQKERGRVLLEDEYYLIDIIRERWNNDDTRLQRVIFR